MPAANDLATPYPPVDLDPHAKRVISYFRPADYALWAAGTAAAPGALYAFGPFPRSATEKGRPTLTRFSSPKQNSRTLPGWAERD
jgi:hypothetical protein